MTMPHERMRSLRWGWDVLRALEADLTQERMWVERARKVLLTYLAPDDLERLVETPGAQMPATFAAAINDVRELFEVVRLCTSSAALRRDLQYTLRHFPSAGVARVLVNAATLGDLDSWLAVECDD